MLRTRMAFLVCCIFAVGMFAFAQDDKAKSHPDFSGSWVLDGSKSDFGRPAGTTTSATGSAEVLLKDPEFRVKRKLNITGQERTSDLLYYTDERGETNQASFGSGEVKSKTKWDGSKLVSTATITRTMPTGESMSFDTEETWELSEDGKVLTDSVSLKTPMGTRSIKYVYNRAPPPAKTTTGYE